MTQLIPTTDPFFNDNKKEPASISKMPLIATFFVVLTILTTAVYVVLNINKQPTSADVQSATKQTLEADRLQYVEPLTPPAPE